MTPTIPRSPAAQAASYHPTALISGGSSGIGLELAKLFARDGYGLVLVAHNEAKLAAAAEQLRASYGRTSRLRGRPSRWPTKSCSSVSPR